MGNSRIKKFQKQIDCPHLIENPIDLFYLTGQNFSKGLLLVQKDRADLYVDGRYFAQAKKQGICTVHKLEAFQAIEYEKIAFDSAFVTFDVYETRKKTHPKVHWIGVPSPLKRLRAVKEPDEIAALKRARDLTLQGIKRVQACLQEGISEEALAMEFEIFCRKNGAMRLSFEPIIAFGENSAYPHHRAGKDTLQKGQVVLIDAGAVVDQYAGDLTRIVYFGDPDPRIQKLEMIVAEAKERATALALPGVKSSQLDAAVRDIFEREGVKQLYTHSLGHGVGLETHEFPILRVEGKDSDTILEENMVITIEPGLYMPGVGGVRLEDMVFVDAKS